MGEVRDQRTTGGLARRFALHFGLLFVAIATAPGGYCTETGAVADRYQG